MNIDIIHASVQLPARVEADDLVSLGDQLSAQLTAVRAARRRGATAPAGCPVGVEIPAIVTASFTRFRVLYTDLRRVTVQRMATPTAPALSATQTAANDACDDAWRAVEPWLRGWTRHRDDGAAPSADDAQVLYGKLFPPSEGLRFIAWRPRKQWATMQSRMPVLNAPETVALVTALGGARLLAAVRDTVAEFGRAYGFTEAQAQSAAEATDLRPQFLAAKDALRDYVKKVEGSADPDIAQSEALATWLLRPFTALVVEFASRPAPRGKSSAPTADATKTDLPK